MEIKEKLKESIKNGLIKIGAPVVDFDVDYPADFKNGDYSTNAPLKVLGLIFHQVSKTRGKGVSTTYQVGTKIFYNPLDLAEKLVESLGKISGINEIKIAKPGFINFFLSSDFLAKNLKEVLEQKENFGKNNRLAGKKVMVEYTDPNPFKEFHIGHLMSNAIGEALSRLIEWSGASVRRANYQGDVGLHVAKAIWGKMRESSLSWGEAYASGAKNYENDTRAKKEIEEINKKVFEKSDLEINKLYDQGREESLKRFEELYKKLGTKFDRYFFESEVAATGKKIVEDNISKGVFEKSEGAIIFPGEKYGLHNRVFITSGGLPTYEAKDIALNKKKFEEEDLDLSIIITASEQNEYFKVVLKALEQIYPEVAEKTKHIGHGMMRLTSGKMSSRTGEVIVGESLIVEAQNLVKAKMSGRDFEKEDIGKISEEIAVAGIKYSILKQSIGRDIVYDSKQALSFEGDSGPYLQYTYVRAESVVKKARDQKKNADLNSGADSVTTLGRLLYRFPEIVTRAGEEYSPQQLVGYLINLASEFNSFYAKEKIIDESDKASPQKLALTEAVSIVLRNGLEILGIKSPERM